MSLISEDSVEFWQPIIAQRWKDLQQTVAECAALSPFKQTVEIVAVTKYATLAQIEAAHAVGIRRFGENKVQDALAKKAVLRASWCQPGPDRVHWHLIGQLQRNKVVKAVGAFDLIHSVDRWELAHKLDEVATQRGLKQLVLLQVNITNELSKAGFEPDRLIELADSLMTLKVLDIQGLMTVARAGDPPEALESTFLQLQGLRDGLAARMSCPLLALSMGMSDDYRHAIACGATIVRVGSALFGAPRP